MKGLISVLFFLSTIASYGSDLPYRMIKLRKLSQSQKTFVIALGKEEGIFEGVSATFTGKDISFIAQAISVNRHHSQWRVQNPKGLTPFSEGDLITMHNAEEYLWTLTESAYSQRQERFKEERKTKEKFYALTIKGGYFRGISQSVSQVDTDEETDRSGFNADLLFEYPLSYRFSLLGGARFAKETINEEDGSISTTRYMLTTGAQFNFDKIVDLYNSKFYTGLLLGYGPSQTNVPGGTHQGNVLLIPSVFAGLMFPLKNNWGFVFELSLESLSTREKTIDEVVQKTNQINARFGVGLKKHF